MDEGIVPSQPSNEIGMAVADVDINGIFAKAKRDVQNRVQSMRLIYRTDHNLKQNHINMCHEQVKMYVTISPQKCVVYGNLQS